MTFITGSKLVEHGNRKDKDMFGFKKKEVPINPEFLKKNNFVEIKNDDRIIVDMMYAKSENIFLRPIYQEVGFGKNAIVHVDVAVRLRQISDELERLNLRIRLCDAYRPPIAHRRALSLIPVQGFFASSPEKSKHCYGTAIDVVLTDEKGRNLRFPTEVDAYEKKYAKQIAKGIVEPFYKHLERARQDFMDTRHAEEINNRELLKRVMLNAGFEAISTEWWHYQLPEGGLDGEEYPFVEWNNW